MGRECFAGVMSGTSLDGVDAVLADFANGQCRVLGAVSRAFPAELRAQLLALQSSGPDELARAAGAANALADIYADAILAVLSATATPPADLQAAGVHGQTVRHRPELGWTLQLNNAARVAERAGVRIVADFRSRDVAAGGQGAPLVPVFHAAWFGHPTMHRVIVNLGGIANITDLPPAGGVVRGFDTGPGNVLLDLWCMAQRGAAFDHDGAWARSGHADSTFLATLLAEPYFASRPPKSTGRDLFNRAWLDGKLQQHARAGGAAPAPADVQATLLALTVHSVADAIESHCHGVAEILLCGGGANNRALRESLAERLACCTVGTTAEHGIAVEMVEPLAFAWLAREALAGRPGNLPAVTGARGLRILGAVYAR